MSGLSGDDVVELTELMVHAKQVLADELDPTDANTAYKLAEAVVDVVGRVIWLNQYQGAGYKD